MRLTILLLLACATLPLPALAASNSGGAACASGIVWEDDNGNGLRDAGERPVAGVKISDGRRIVTSDAQGRYAMPWQAGEGRTLFAIKPPGYDFPLRANGLPSFWVNDTLRDAPTLKYGGLKAPAKAPRCIGFPLRPRAADAKADAAPLQVLVFTDTQVKNETDGGYYARDIVEPLVGKTSARLGLTLGDLVNDDLSLYPSLNRTTARLAVPWLPIAGNHDLDFDAPNDEASLLTYRNTFGPDTVAWEEAQAVFIGMDDVIYQPAAKPSYVGGLREEQFAFLEAYLPTVPKDKLLVIGVHIPFFDAEPGRETFRHADRKRLFALLQPFPHVLLLSGHSHSQRHVDHGPESDWHGATPLHEFNVGAACGAYWSGVKDAQGIPDSTMADGTPNGYATLEVGEGGRYALDWHPARDAQRAMFLHAPKVLRQGAYPAWGVYANVFMGQADTRVEFRVDGGEWKPMVRVEQPDPGLTVENVRDDEADALRGFDRSPEATPSQHLWRGALPTQLAAGTHQVEVRAQDRWRGERIERTEYRLQAATE